MNRNMFRLCQRLMVAAFALTILGLGAASEAKPHDPTRFETAIARFEKQDAESPPPQGAILFVGSSSVRRWDLSKYFPDRRTINRGFGGSYFSDAAYFAERIVLKHKPRVVVLFSGNNDLNAGKSVEKVHDDFRAFVAKLHKSLPETRLVSIGVNPSPRRWENATKIQELNRLLQADCEQDGLLDFVDVWEVMLGEDGQPRKALFVKDGLHLNDEGYRLWARLVRPYLAPKGQSDKNGLNRK